MDLLKEFIYDEKININGKAITREAVRAIIMKEDKLLMVYSLENKDYKFPGGGMEEDEKFEITLKREVLEECGALIEEIEKEFGKVIEYFKPREEDYDVFIMTSYYYFCDIEEELDDEDIEEIDEYEEELGFTPVWVDIDEAINTNRALLESGNDVPRWATRDTFILEELKKKM